MRLYRLSSPVRGTKRGIFRHEAPSFHPDNPQTDQSPWPLPPEPHPQQPGNGTAIWNLAFNVNVEPFADVKVRKALAMAVKRDDIIAGAMDGAGMPAEIILTDQTAPNPGADAIDTPKYDVEGARALLAEAGYPDGFKTTIYAFFTVSPSDTFTLFTFTFVTSAETVFDFALSIVPVALT